MGALTNAMRLQRRSSGPSSGTIEGVPAKTVVLLYTADLLEHVKSDGGVCFLRFSEVLITSDTTIFYFGWNSPVGQIKDLVTAPKSFRRTQRA